MLNEFRQDITATLIKLWFQYSCDRQFRYGSLSRSDRRELQIYEENEKPPELWAEYGLKFEKNIFQSLRGSLLGSEEASKGQMDAIVTAFLLGKCQERYLRFAEFFPNPDAMRLKLPAGARFGKACPDLLRMDVVDGCKLLTVIEIKAVRRATRFHKAQTAFYAEVLASVLEARNSDVEVSDKAEIWYLSGDDIASGKPASETFSLAPYRRLVRHFIENDLDRIFGPKLSYARDETFFHIYFKCEQCAYLTNCVKSISGDDPRALDISAVPGLSHEGKRMLHEKGVRTVGELANFTSLRQEPGLAWSLKRSARLLVERAQAIVKQKVNRTTEPYTMLMPHRVDTAVYLIADHDAVADRLITLGCRIVRRDGSTDEHVAIIDQDAPQGEADALVKVFGMAIGELTAIDQHNAKLSYDPDTSIYAHIFVYEPAEANNIKDAVGRNLDDPRICAGLLDMIRLFPPEDVTPEPEFRGVQHLPATAIRSVVENLYALPVLVSYDLARVSQALLTAQHAGRAYRPASGFERPFSSLLAMDVIRRFRDGGSPDTLRQEIEADVRSRLQASEAVCRWLISESQKAAATASGHLLRLSKRPFKFWRSVDPLDAGDLDLLLALELIESRSNLLACLVALARPPERRDDLGKSMTGLTVTGTNARQFRFVDLELRLPPEYRGTELGPRTHAVVLTDNNYEILLDPSSWSGAACNILSIDRDKVVIRLRSSVFQGAPFQEMWRRSHSAKEGWCLDEVVRDVNTQRIESFLRHLHSEVAS